MLAHSHIAALQELSKFVCGREDVHRSDCVDAPDDEAVVDDASGRGLHDVQEPIIRPESSVYDKTSYRYTAGRPVEVVVHEQPSVLKSEHKVAHGQAEQSPLAYGDPLRSRAGGIRPAGQVIEHHLDAPPFREWV